MPSPSTETSPAPSTDPAALRAKIARLLMVGFRGLEIGPDDDITKALAAGLGGVILFDRDQITGGQRNIASPKQLAKLTAALRAAAPGPILIGIDQEGGKVSRLNPAKGFPATRTQAAIGATGDPANARAAGKAMGTTMQAAGLDLDLAPVVDVNVNPRNPAIGALDRSFSADPGGRGGDGRGRDPWPPCGRRAVGRQALPRARQRRGQHRFRGRRRDEDVVRGRARAVPVAHRGRGRWTR